MASPAAQWENTADHAGASAGWESTVDHGASDRGPTLGDQVSGFFSKLADRLNPIPALKQLYGQPEEVGSALDAFHELTKLHNQAAKDPRNQGKPVNQWIEPEPTPQQQATIERGVNARLPSAEGGMGPVLDPALQAGTEIQRGDPQGAAATLTAGYLIPALAGKILSGAADSIDAAHQTLQAAAKKAPDLQTAADLAGVLSPRSGYALRVLNKVRQAMTPEELASPEIEKAPPFIPPGDFTGSSAALGPVAPVQPITPRSVSFGGGTVMPPVVAPAPVVPRAPRVPVWSGIPDAPAAVVSDAAAAPTAPAVLPSGRRVGGPAFDPQTGEMLDAVGNGEFKAPQAKPVTAPPAKQPDVKPVAKPSGAAAKPSFQQAAGDLAEELTGSREGAKIEAQPSNGDAIKAQYQAKRAQVIADKLYGHGITYEEASNLTPEHLSDAHWEQILGKDPATGKQFHAPSQDTLDQAVKLIGQKYAVAQNPKAMGAAMDLVQELSK